jgi:hypothetical protein
MTALEREEKARQIITDLSHQRDAMIDAVRKLVILTGEPQGKLLNVVFTRKFAPRHMLAWWKANVVRLQARFRHDEAYESAAAKLTAEERKVLGL